MSEWKERCEGVRGAAERVRMRVEKREERVEGERKDRKGVDKADMVREC